MAMEVDQAIANLIEKHRLVSEASDRVIEAHALYHKALVEEFVAEMELKQSRKKVIPRPPNWKIAESLKSMESGYD